MGAGLLGNKTSVVKNAFFMQWKKPEIILYTAQDSHDGSSCLFDQDMTDSLSKWAKKKINKWSLCVWKPAKDFYLLQSLKEHKPL